MNLLSQQVKTANHRVSAFVLACWLGGFMCFVCCDKDVLAATAGATDAPQVAENVAAGDACAARSCCHSVGKSSQGLLQRTGQASSLPDGASCCPMSGQYAEQARKIRLLSELVLADTAGNFQPAFRVFHLHGTAERVLHTPDCSGTYLRWCVFLI